MGTAGLQFYRSKLADSEVVTVFSVCLCVSCVTDWRYAQACLSPTACWDFYFYFLTLKISFDTNLPELLTVASNLTE